MGQVDRRGNYNFRRVKNSKTSITKSKQGAKIIRGGRGNSGQTGNSRGRRKKNNQCSVHNNLIRLNCTEFRQVSHESFKEAFDNARNKNKNVNCVDTHTLDELKDMKCLRTDNGFVAVETNGNINSVLKDVFKGRVDNFLRDLILNAVLNDRI